MDYNSLVRCNTVRRSSKYRPSLSCVHVNDSRRLHQTVKDLAQHDETWPMAEYECTCCPCCTMVNDIIWYGNCNNNRHSEWPRTSGALAWYGMHREDHPVSFRSFFGREARLRHYQPRMHIPAHYAPPQNSPDLLTTAGQPHLFMVSSCHYNP